MMAYGVMGADKDHTTGDDPCDRVVQAGGGGASSGDSRMGRLEILERELATLRPVKDRLESLERELANLRARASLDFVIFYPIPEVARGHEDLLRLFLNGRLVYKPNTDNDTGMVEIPIKSLANPLAGKFDLSKFGDTSGYLSIHTGYKDKRIPANANTTEVWICPRFLGVTVPEFSDLIDTWESPIGYFCCWGGHKVGKDNFNYLLDTEQCMDNEKSLHEKLRISHGCKKCTPIPIGKTFYVKF